MTNVLTHSKFILLNGSEGTGFDPQIGFKNKSLFIWFFDLVRFCTYGTSLSNDNLFFVYIQKVVICETLLDSFNVKTVESRMISTIINTHYWDRKSQWIKGHIISMKSPVQVKLVGCFIVSKLYFVFIRYHLALPNTSASLLLNLPTNGLHITKGHYYNHTQSIHSIGVTDTWNHSLLNYPSSLGT